MANTRNVGPSVEKLERANSDACNNSEAFQAAKKEYDEIMKNASKYIASHAPVTQIVLCRNAYKDGMDLHDSNLPKNVLFLAAKSVLNAPTGNKDEYISTHKITEMLRYILITEGWQTYYSNDTYKIDITRNGNICSI